MKRTVGLPQHIEERRARHEDDPDAHAMQVIQSGYQSLEVATKAQLGFSDIVFIHGLEEVIVAGIAVGELV